MTKAQLFEQILRKRSFLCVGLDTVGDDVFEFNKRIIDATHQYAVAYKPNLAFYEGRWEEFGRTCAYIRENHPEMLIIADAKRGDIGNTSEMYARAFARVADAVTVAPYMGRDSVEPFLSHVDWAVVLALTSNPSADDFETLRLESGEFLWQRVLETAKTWGSADNMMFVVGATRAETLEEVRKIVPDHFLLVPGVGAQGGSLEDVAKYGMNGECGLLVNSSRGVIYASDPAAEARSLAEQMGALMDRFLK